MHVRLAPEALARGVAVMAIAACLAAGCGRQAPAIALDWRIEPTPPVTGTDTSVRITMRDDRGRPIAGARLRLEAHMSHPGMTPATATLTEENAGEYAARVTLSMAGDWIFVVSGELAGGTRITREREVPGVRNAG